MTQCSSWPFVMTEGHRKLTLCFCFARECNEANKYFQGTCLLPRGSGRDAQSVFPVFIFKFRRNINGIIGRYKCITLFWR